MSKAKKTRTKLKKHSVVIIITTVLCLLLLGFLIFYLINENKFYKIESRIEEAAKKAKKDTDEIKTLGWLRVQGTDIDYPIFYAPEYEFSLDMENFVWTESNFDGINNIMYIQGHNVLNLSKKPLITESYHNRFEQLMSFTYLDFVKNNKYIQLTYKGKEYLYKIFAVSYPLTDDIDVYNVTKYSKEKLQKYIDKSKKESIFDFDVDVNSNDKILSLTTCTRMFGSNYSFKVDARMVRELEPIKNYDVKKTKEYDKVDEQMKGGSSNENEEV